MRVIVSECGASRKTLEKSDENGEFRPLGNVNSPLPYTSPQKVCHAYRSDCFIVFDGVLFITSDM